MKYNNSGKSKLKIFKTFYFSLISIYSISSCGITDFFMTWESWYPIFNIFEKLGRFCINIFMAESLTSYPVNIISISVSSFIFEFKIVGLFKFFLFLNNASVWALIVPFSHPTLLFTFKIIWKLGIPLESPTPCWKSVSSITWDKDTWEASANNTL